MDALDLRTAPPRSGRAELAGIVFLPRTIDKARATLPGGNSGEYRMQGFSERFLDTVGIPVADFTTAVAGASSDDDVVRFLRASTSPEKIAEWNDFILQRQPSGGDREAAYTNYPWLRERPDLILALDVLEEDDRRLFATP
ncbi:MAG: DUF5069 domain-containing protein [Candidatus Eremiobacteraeota bacterium]|nr:DUF5069 domain-containing protein [Candidatus Eremiobacteraeota bacterium]